MPNQKFLLVLFAVLYFSTIGFSQTPVLDNDTQIRPTAVAVPIETDPLIDGNILKDEVWQKIKPFGGLLQSQPNYGQMASERTEIRIAYTEHTFYLAVVCYDSDPDGLVSFYSGYLQR